MKSSFFTITFCLLSIAAYSQKTKFNGIGIFKIGCDTSVVYQYAKSLDVDVKALDNSTDYYARLADNKENQALKRESEYHVFRLINSPNETFRYVASTCPGTSEYFLNEYPISGVNLYNVKLTFYHNKLIRLGCDYNEDISKAMTSKYGPPIITRKIKPVICVYKLTGNKEANRSIDETLKWINGSIIARSNIWIYYNQNCKQTIVSSFNYGITVRELDACENPIEPKTKPKLKDF